MQSFNLDPGHFDLIVVSGPDAERFLQGQVTCDVAALKDNTFTYGAICTNKGRVITPFLIGKPGQDFHLVFSKGLGPLFMAALKKFLPFYKCTLQLAENGLVCAGIAGPETLNVLQSLSVPCPEAGFVTPVAGGWIASLAHDPRQVLICVDSATWPRYQAAMAMLVEDTGTRWQALGMLQGHFPFAVTDTERYTPQELHYDRKDYVSFSKGCYTGQEIVARMHYRGKIKKQFYLVRALQTETSTVPDHQSEDWTLLDSSGSVVAQCIKAAQLDSRHSLALVELPLEVAAQDPTLTTQSGLAVQVLPFQAG